MPILQEELSEREVEILKLIATGASNKEIASLLSISTNTVKVHARNIFTKIGVSSRTEAAMYAINSGLIPMNLEPSLETGASVEGTAGLPAPPITPLGPSKWHVWIGALIVLALGGIGVLLQRPSPSTAPEALGETTRWQNLPALPTARSAFGAVVLDDELYAIGGMTGDGPTGVVEIFDLNSQQWSVGMDKPTPVGEIGAAVVRGRILVPGGRLSSGAVSRALEIYDPNLKTWSQGAELPVGLSAYALAAYEGQLYLFGGWDGKAYTNQVYAYNIEADQWEELPPMPTRRGYATAAAAGRKIYLMGGFDGERGLRANEVFEPDLVDASTNAWESASPLPVSVQYIGSASIADNIYIFGSNPSPNQANQTFIYAPQTGNWQSIETPKQLLGEGLRVVGWGANIYTLGGEVDQKPVDTHLVYQAVVIISFPVISK